MRHELREEHGNTPWGFLTRGKWLGKVKYKYKNKAKKLRAEGELACGSSPLCSRTRQA